MEASQQAAQQAWDLVDLCRDMGSSDTTGDAAVVDTMEEDKGTEGDAHDNPATAKSQVQEKEDLMDIDDGIETSAAGAEPMAEDSAETKI